MSERLPARAWRTLCEEGLRGLWFRSLAVLGYRRLYLLRRPLSEPIPDCAAAVPVTIEWLTAEDVAAYRAFRTRGHGDDPARRLSEGDRCLVARHDGRIVGAMWGSNTRARSDYLGRNLPLAAGEAFQFNAYTTPAMRGMGIAPALSVAWLRHLRDAGCPAVLRLTLPENAAALRAHAKAGYRTAAIVRSLRLGPWRCHLVPWAVALEPGDSVSPAARRSTSRSSS